MKRDGKPWTSAEMATLSAYWRSKDFSPEEIADAMQRSKHAIANKANRMGLGVRPPTRTRGAYVTAKAVVLHAKRGSKPRKPHKVDMAPPVVDRIGHARELLRRGIRWETVVAGAGLMASEIAVLREQVGA